MPEKLNPEVVIVLDKERRLRFDLNAMAAFEEATGKSLFEASAAKILQEKMGAADLRALLWAMLIHEDEQLTLKQVGAWIDIKNIGEITYKLTRAFAAAMPEKTEGEQGAPLAKKRLRG